MTRGLLVALCLLAAACDDSDPATSEHCVMVRMKHIELSYSREQNRRLGSPTDALDLALAKLVNENWACFK